MRCPNILVTWTITTIFGGGDKIVMKYHLRMLEIWKQSTSVCKDTALYLSEWELMTDIKVFFAQSVGIWLGNWGGGGC